MYNTAMERDRVNEETNEYLETLRDWTDEDLDAEVFKRIVINDDLSDIIEITDELSDLLVCLTVGSRDNKNLQCIAKNIGDIIYDQVINSIVN